MMSELIPNDVRQFILNRIDSVSDLEALLLLRKHSDQNWTAQSVSRRIYTEEDAAAQILARLTASGLCTGKDGAYCYGPSFVSDCDLVDRLADLYTRYLIPVTNLIHNKPARIQQFADAFRFRKDK